MQKGPPANPDQPPKNSNWNYKKTLKKLWIRVLVGQGDCIVLIQIYVKYNEPLWGFLPTLPVLSVQRFWNQARAAPESSQSSFRIEPEQRQNRAREVPESS